ncbi:MAG: serine/threonine-protein phosphatase [Clostridia bacterium]|nr:serine/threonine-protein phosphatase [Clostridia bacterium]
MRKIYEAYGENKKGLIEINNDYMAWNRKQNSKNDIGIKDFIMIGSIPKELLNEKIDIRWCLNGLMPKNLNTEDITIIEPLSEHFDETLTKVNEIDTCFYKEIELSSNAIILMSVNLYDELIKEKKYNELLSKFNVRLYEGEKELALRMLFFDKRYIYLDLDDEGFAFDEDNHPDLMPYNYLIADKEDEIMKKVDKGEIKELRKIKKPKVEREEKRYKNCKMISAFTKEVEGNIELDNMQAATDIGKIRENQEDAILLIKNKENPNFKMMVVADGVGGSEFGEVASNVIIEKLKDWFEDLPESKRKCYYTGVSELKEDLIDEIELRIQPAVQYETMYYGASTLVCAIVGEKDTLVANVGDSRAYIVKKGKLIQVSREDTVAQENLEKGKTPSKEIARFDNEANVINQCIGMNRNDLIHPNVEIIDNKDYDLLLLFTDGVTDCLSDEDIAVACRTTDKKELANKIVEKAIKNDSILKEEYAEQYNHLTLYIPGGKDNTTAAIYIPENGEER